MWKWCFDPCFPPLSVGRALLLRLRCEFQLVWRRSGAVMQVQHLLFFCYYLGSALHTGVRAVVAFLVHRMGRDETHAIILPHPPHHLPLCPPQVASPDLHPARLHPVPSISHLPHAWSLVPTWGFVASSCCQMCHSAWVQGSSSSHWCAPHWCVYACSLSSEGSGV